MLQRGQRWSGEELDRVREMAARGVPAGFIAENLGRSPEAVAARLSMLGLAGQRGEGRSRSAFKSSDEWSESERIRLREMVGDDKSLRLIAIELKRTQASIKAELARWRQPGRGT